MAAIYLKPLDDGMARAGIALVRYMDDWVIMTTRRHQLRKGIRLIKQTLQQLKLSIHPDKTEMGKIDRGFTFLGYHHTRAGLPGTQVLVEQTALAGATGRLPLVL